MASSRDDFIIAIRSAFLKKSTQQKFSLLTLVSISIFVIVLSSLDFKVIRYLKIGINELVYRSSFVVSITENLIKNSTQKMKNKNCDVIFANDVSKKEIGFNSDFNKVSMIDQKGNIKILPKNKKSYIANKIAQILLDKLIDDRNIN